MLTFKPKAFARELKEENPDVKRMTVAVVDSDLCLVIQVFDESGEVIGYHDTGLDADDDSSEAEVLANKLVAALKSGRKPTRVQAKCYNPDRAPEEQWAAEEQADE